jgi:predicted dehydrogenase
VTGLRVGCVGTGFIAGRHLSALAAMDDVEVVAVADAQRDRAQDVARRYGATAPRDGAELLERDDLDAVWLCVPPSAHGPLELAAVARGLPFFVEKPLAVDLAGAVRVAERSAGAPAHLRRLPLALARRRALARDALADQPVDLLTATWLDSTPTAPWWSRRSGSGGQLVEQTTHLVDLARCSSVRSPPCRRWSRRARARRGRTPTCRPPPRSCSGSPPARSGPSPRAACSTGATT